MRFALRWHMRDSGANLTGTPRLNVGLCSGSGVGSFVSDATTAHFVGVRTPNATWTRSVDDYVMTGVTAWLPTKRINTTFTDGSALATSWSIGNQAVANRAERSLFFIEITKGSPNYSFQIFYFPNAAGAVADVSKATFDAEARVGGTPVVTGHALSSAITLAVDEATNGTLDHVHIYWDRATPEVEITDYAIHRITP